MRITVTPDHIARGRRGSVDQDPLALALHDHGLADAIVGTNVVYVGDPTVEVPLPPAVADWLVRWDRHGKGDPFAFDLDLAAGVPC